MGITRRKFVQATAAGTLAAGSGIAPLTFAASHKTVKVGMNIPMTGDYAPWGLPGLYGCQIVADNLNAAGGVDISVATSTRSKSSLMTMATISKRPFRVTRRWYRKTKSKW